MVSVLAGKTGFSVVGSPINNFMMNSLYLPLRLRYCTQTFLRVHHFQVQPRCDQEASFPHSCEMCVIWWAGTVWGWTVESPGGVRYCSRISAALQGKGQLLLNLQETFKGRQQLLKHAPGPFERSHAGYTGPKGDSTLNSSVVLRTP